jgi:dolichol-phosphate mannosyltransferase
MDDVNVAQRAARIGVVIPCYRVTRHILAVILKVGPEVDTILCVDDACPDRSGDFIEANCKDPRVVVLRNDVNLGVGGAVIKGYREALRRNLDVVVKIDGDGQMDPALVLRFVSPIISGAADYTKGNRFYSPELLRQMPNIRIFGNAILSFMSKLSSGYWDIFDPTNGYTAISASVLDILRLDKIDKRYFFESDMLFRLNIIRAKVVDIPMFSRYADEESGLKISKVIGPFLLGNLRNLGKRIVYNYYLRDFNVASVEMITSIALLTFGITFGLYKWISAGAEGEIATAGTVMLSALPIMIGVQLFLSALSYDVSSTPSEPIHRRLSDKHWVPVIKAHDNLPESQRLL